MNILITGGTGNIGSRLLIPLIQRGDRVFLLDVRSRPHFESPEAKRVEVIQADLGDREAIFEAVRSRKIDSIFHLGAVLSSNAEDQPSDAWKANMDGMVHVLDAARTHGVKRVVFSSTIASYGAGLASPLSLDAPQWPVSLYGVTKVAGERLGNYYFHRFGLDFRGIRLPVVVAARGAAGGASAFCSAVFEESVFHGKYEFYVPPETRSPMLYIGDVVRAFVDLHDAAPEKLRHRVYNITGMNPSAEELAAAVRKRLPEARITYKPDPLRAAIVQSWPNQIDDSDARRDWGWKSTWDLERMADTIIEALQNELAGKQ
jgi:threonine 3-dehydrogenase